MGKPITAGRTVKVRLPRLYKKQMRAIYSGKRYTFVEGSTKSGKTHGAIHWLITHALKSPPGGHVLWCAPVIAQAKIAYRRLKIYLRNWAGIVKFSDSERRVYFLGAGCIVFNGSERPDLIFGEDYHAIVIDEASRCREESWEACRSTVTNTNGPILAIGNVKGRRNWFYKLGQRAKAGWKRGHYAKLTAYDAIAGGVITEEEIEDAKDLLPEHVFNELYLCIPTEDGSNPFDMSRIAAIATLEGLAAGPVVCWGWDLAKKQDFTVGIGLNIRGEVCAFERFQMPWEETIARILDVTNCDALVDATGVGDPIVERLQAEAQRLASEWTEDETGKRHAPKPLVQFEGFMFNHSSKQALMEGLAVAIGKRNVTIQKEGVLRDELESFEYVLSKTLRVQYSAPEGLYDDAVCAFAMAVRKFEQIALFAVPVKVGVIKRKKVKRSW
jgi:hypothetical protein